MPQKKDPKCPECGEPMQYWFYDMDIEESPTVDKFTGYSCHNCQATFINLDDTTFDGFFYNSQLTWLNKGG